MKDWQKEIIQTELGIKLPEIETMTKPLDYFKDHPASPDASEKPLAWKYGYLIGIIKGAMYLNNKQEMKNALMEALDYLEKHEG
jgi:hypothetical protein